jgi:hypothetical protein
MENIDTLHDENELRVFHNRLRILMGIDRHELVDAGIITNEPNPTWSAFVFNPYLWLIRCSDDDAAKLWTVIKRREENL